ncbi:hypothetical protein Emag_002294 [Eimeria magna]
MSNTQPSRRFRCEEESRGPYRGPPAGPSRLHHGGPYRSPGPSGGPSALNKGIPNEIASRGPSGGPSGRHKGGPSEGRSGLRHGGPSEYFIHDPLSDHRFSPQQQSPRQEREGPPGGPPFVKRYGGGRPPIREHQMRVSDGSPASCISCTISSQYSPSQTMRCTDSSSSSRSFVFSPQKESFEERKWQGGSRRAWGEEGDNWKAFGEESSGLLASQDVIDNSRSTTRSSSNSRCLVDFQKSLEVCPKTKEIQTEGTATDAHAAVAASAAVQSSPPAVAAAAAASAAVSLEEGLKAATEDIEGMTEKEVRIYALQMQALTHVLLNNMSRHVIRLHHLSISAAEAAAAAAMAAPTIAAGVAAASAAAKQQQKQQ